MSCIKGEKLVVFAQYVWVAARKYFRGKQHSNVEDGEIPCNFLRFCCFIRWAFRSLWLLFCINTFVTTHSCEITRFIASTSVPFVFSRFVFIYVHTWMREYIHACIHVYILVSRLSFGSTCILGKTTALNTRREISALMSIPIKF